MSGAVFMVSLMLRSLGRWEHSVTITFWFTALVGAAAMQAFPRWRPIDPAHWPWLVTPGLTGTFGQILLTAAFRCASAAVIAPYDYTHMIWAIVYGWMFWGEIPGARTWAGTAIIVGSGLFILVRERRLKTVP